VTLHYRAALEAETPQHRIGGDPEVDTIGVALVAGAINAGRRRRLTKDSGA
jgi:hypothetical protein